MATLDGEEDPPSFGAVLRAHREAAKLRQGDLGALVGCGSAHIGHIERGIRAAKRELAEACEGALGLAPGTLTEHLPQDPLRLDHWIEYERKATVLLTYQIAVIPGLLQTKEYATAVLRGSPTRSEHEISDAVKSRISRRVILARQKPPLFWAIIDEAAMRRTLGGRKVMHEQLQALIHAAQHPHITIQVLPFSAECAAGVDGGYIIAQVPGKPDAVYAPSALRGDVRTRFDELGKMHTRHRVLTAHAMPEQESVAFIRKVMEEL